MQGPVDDLKVLTIIGCILGIIFMFGVYLYIDVVGIPNSKSGELAELTAYNVIRSSLDKTFSPAGTLISIAVYIICLVVPFVSEEKYKEVGITLIVLGIIPVAITNIWGILPFVFLFAAGIVALTSKFD